MIEENKKQWYDGIAELKTCPKCGEDILVATKQMKLDMPTLGAATIGSCVNYSA